MPIQHLLSGRAAAKEARLLKLNGAAHAPVITPRLASKHSSEAQHLLSSGENVAGNSCSSTCDGSSARSYESSPGLWAAVLPSVVLVSVPGSGWASGIVMSEDGFVLTNAHVVQPRDSSLSHSRAQDSHPPVIKLRLSASTAWHVADVVYVFKHVLDLAVLRMRAAPDSLRLQAAVLQCHAVSAGQPIAIVAHALFSPDRSMQPSITAGNVSKVIRQLAWQCCIPCLHLPSYGLCSQSNLH